MTNTMGLNPAYSITSLPYRATFSFPHCSLLENKQVLSKQQAGVKFHTMSEHLPSRDVTHCVIRPRDFIFVPILRRPCQSWGLGCLEAVVDFPD